MPVISARASQGDGKWKPLPNGTYDFTIDAVKERVSGAGNQMLHLETHVAGGEFQGKKAGQFYTLVDKAGWRLKLLLDATGVDYNEVPLDGVVDDDGRPVTELQFDTDDLVGKTFTADVTIRKDNKGEDQNAFNNERCVGEDKPRSQQEREQPAAQAAATTTKPAAQPAQQAAKPAAQGAAPAQRRAIR
jgi:hypothetical protein